MCIAGVAFHNCCNRGCTVEKSCLSNSCREVRILCDRGTEVSLSAPRLKETDIIIILFYHFIDQLKRTMEFLGSPKANYRKCIRDRADIKCALPVRLIVPPTINTTKMERKEKKYTVSRPHDLTNSRRSELLILPSLSHSSIVSTSLIRTHRDRWSLRFRFLVPRKSHHPSHCTFRSVVKHLPDENSKVTNSSRGKRRGCPSDAPRA